MGNILHLKHNTYERRNSAQDYVMRAIIIAGLARHAHWYSYGINIMGVLIKVHVHKMKLIPLTIVRLRT